MVLAVDLVKARCIEGIRKAFTREDLARGEAKVEICDRMPVSTLVDPGDCRASRDRQIGGLIAIVQHCYFNALNGDRRIGNRWCRFNRSGRFDLMVMWMG